MLYEINYLVLQSKTADLDAIRQEIKKLVESFGAKITGEKNYLKRKLAYEIKHEGYGFYTVLRYELADTEKVAQLKRELNLNTNVCRYIMVKADELPDLSAETPKEEIPAVMEKETTAELAAKKEAAIQPTIKEEETPTENVSAAKEEKEEKVSAPVEAVEKTEKELKKPVKEEKAEKKPEAKKEEAEVKDDKASLDELDKKLDEILNS